MYFGHVVPGNKNGRKIGFPTFNLVVPKIKIDFGVYVVNVLIDGVNGFGIMHYGPRLTVDNKITVEINVLDYDSYKKVSEVGFNILKKIRGIKKFNSLNDLKNQIIIDRDFAKNFIDA